MSAAFKRVVFDRKLKVYGVTWNMHGKPPPADLSILVPADKYDIVAVGTEECERTIAKSFLKQSKSSWESSLCTCLGDGYVMLASHALVAIHIVVFIRKELRPFCQSIQTAHVATGIANRLGNKGGVAVSFNFAATSMMFMAIHLAAHQHAVAERNAQWLRIESLLPLPQARKVQVGLLEKVKHSHSLASHRFDRCFILGDLNYRIEGTRKVVDVLLQSGLHEVLLANDQLLRARKEDGIFANFSEAPIKFMPTYKFDLHSDEYDSSEKARIPAFTDRILYRPEKHIRCLSYDSIQSLRTSDHRPVAAEFEMAFDLGDLTKLKDGRWGSKMCSIL
jgi:hypothetical protein